MKKASVLFLLLLLAAPAFAQECGSSFSSLSDEAFVRRASGSALDPVYRRNMERVMEGFSRALDAPGPPADFKAFLKQQHRLAAIGEVPGTFYWPAMGNIRKTGEELKTPLPLAEKYAGTLRYELFDRPDTLPLTHDLTLAPSILSEIERYKPNLKAKDVFASGIPQRFYVPKIDRIPPNAGPRFTRLSDGNVQFDYPAARFLPPYLKKMETSFAKVQGGLRQKKVNPEKVLQNLADYYQAIIVGHPFLRVNNSMAMGQVNVVLQRLGMKPVAHGDLDYVMRALNSNDARQAFTEYVKKAQGLP